jgi:hypothetical protein
VVAGELERPSAEEIRAVYRARMLTSMDRHDEAIAEAERALEAATARDSMAGRARATFMKGRAIRYSDRDDALALRLLEQAVQLAERSGDEVTALWAGQDAAALISKDPERAVEVERMLRPLIARAEHLDFGLPYTARVYYLLGKALRQQERWEEAAAAYAESARQRELALGPHPATANSRMAEGDMLRKLGRIEDAHEQYVRCAQIRESVFGPDHPGLGRATFRVALTAFALGDHDEARREGQRAVESLELGNERDRELAARVARWLTAPEHEAAEPPPAPG